jgi:chaperonin GroEL
VDAIVADIIKNNIGYNSLTGKFEDLFDTGVIDPLRCVKNEIINAVSTAGVLMTSNVAIATIEKK